MRILSALGIGKTRLYISKRPAEKGGGSNTFAAHFTAEAGKRGYHMVRTLKRADLAIVIANQATEQELAAARANGTFIIHRLDEHFEKNESPARKAKHDRLIALNRYAHLTIFQSAFVHANVYPHIRPEHFRIIHNGGDHSVFKPAVRPGDHIGHITWGVGDKKRLDLLREFILDHPEERFLLVGRHQDSEFDFDLPNVELAGTLNQRDMVHFLHRMKMLYFPSENDPCPNTIVEAILCGVPVCYNPPGGSIELVTGATDVSTPSTNRTVGLPLDRAEELLANLEAYRNNAASRNDLHFTTVFNRYLTAARETGWNGGKR